MDKKQYLNKPYISVGTANIYLEKWINVNRRLDNFSHKARGGLWATELYFYKDYVCEWLDFIRDHNSMSFGMNLDDAVQINLKPTTKLCLLRNIEEMSAISNRYPSMHHQLTFHKKQLLNDYLFIDYDKLKCDYDAIYINYMYKDKSKLDNSNLGCESLIIMNPLCIESYQPIELVRNENSGVFNILSIKEEKEISALNLSYIQLEIYSLYHLRRLIINSKINISNYETFLYEVIKCRELLLEYLITNKTELILKIINNRDDLSVLDVARTISTNCCNLILGEYLKNFYETFLLNSKNSISEINYENVLKK